jgi:hypothetical protein
MQAWVTQASNFGDTITLTVTFDPATPGDYQGNLELAHDGQPGGKSTAFLRGTAV